MRVRSSEPARGLAWVPLSVAALVLTGLVAVLAVPGVRRVLDLRPVAAQEATFDIAGDVSGLYPGATLPLVLTVTNPQTFAIDVRSLTATAVGTDHGACHPSVLSVEGFTGSIVLAAGTHAMRTLEATMSADATDACQDATFVLTYAGTAVQAGLETALDADPVVVRASLNPIVTAGRLSAQLTAPAVPVVGRTVRFVVGGSEVCRAATDDTGTATCTGTDLTLAALRAQGYTAAFDGDTSFKPSEARGELVVVRTP